MEQWESKYKTASPQFGGIETYQEIWICSVQGGEQSAGSRGSEEQSTAGAAAKSYYQIRASPVAEPYADVASDESIHPLEKADFYDLTQGSTLNWESTPAE